MGRLPYSRSSFERVTHAVGAMYEVTHAQVEDTLIEEFVMPVEARALSIGLDRVSVPMEEFAEALSGKVSVERNYRMAFVGTVTLTDEDGEALHTIRYGRMPQGDAEALCEGMMADASALLRKRPGMLVQLLARCRVGTSH